MRWFLFMVDVFVALSCVTFLVTYTTRAAGFHDGLGRTLLAIKFGIFGVAVLLAVNTLANIDVIVVRWIFSLLMVQIGFAVLWQTYMIFKLNPRGKASRGSKNDH